MRRDYECLYHDCTVRAHRATSSSAFHESFNQSQGEGRICQNRGAAHVREDKELPRSKLQPLYHTIGVALVIVVVVVVVLQLARTGDAPRDRGGVVFGWIRFFTSAPGAGMGTTASYLRGTAGPSGYSSNSTAEDVTADLDLTSKTIIVTGATSGIGKECARVLAKRGAHVILAVRNLKLGESVCGEIHKETPAARLDIMHLDLNSLASVREFAADFKSRNLPLNILLNNAGTLLLKFDLSEDGIEQTFAINHLGPFLLTNLLLDTMKATAQKSGEEGRIVNVSSVGHMMTYRNHDLSQISNPNRFMGFMAYGQSKLANILHAKELARRLQEEGANVTANALHPGTMDTGFGKNERSFKILTGIFFKIGSKLVKTTPQAAATSCYVATNPKLEGVSGKFFFDCNEHVPELSAACDMQLAASYWKCSEELIASKNRENVSQLDEAS